MEQLNANTQQNVSTASALQIPRMIPLKQVMHYTALSSTTIYEMVNKKSDRYDPTFPVQVKLSKGRVAWVESEVADWIEKESKGLIFAVDMVSAYDNQTLELEIRKQNMITQTKYFFYICCIGLKSGSVFSLFTLDNIAQFIKF